MSYRICNGTVIADKSNFDVRSTLECGQVFRYTYSEAQSVVYSRDKKAVLIEEEDGIHIISDCPEYWINYFDLDTDYGAIIGKLESEPELVDAVEYGKGIRILRQDLFETIISFIISANNNIGRIKGIIEKICYNYGGKCDGYYAFPTLEQLQGCSASFYRQIGAGFRSEYLEETVRILAVTAGNIGSENNKFNLNDYSVDRVVGCSSVDSLGNSKIVRSDNYSNSRSDFLTKLRTLNSTDAIKMLCTLKGVGAKVADCVLLFGLGRTDSYPVDTWIYKANKSAELDSKTKVREFYVKKYGNLAGYVQQYVFYYARSRQK